MYAAPQPMMMAQPVMMQQPMMMAQPAPMVVAPSPVMMVSQPPPPPAPIVINNNNGGGKNSGNCPICEKGHMLPTKKWGVWTCIVCLCCPIGLCCDCAWSSATKCVSCGHTVSM